ncbi:MAG TPA: hypothetical protein OIM59_01675 [Bacteroides mediterraneensis]|uniref:hypothetical protein n=1 Tax=Bacteroides mediterraneensis TaxID=1841856 RepID=UPI0026EC178C|nr:hypothetical protein [Bacteroides mediterraneensis]HJH63350.1 hypothetical protein [Bacteroides mediterraneensis]
MKTKHLFGILLLFLFTLPFLVGCEKYLIGGEKILGTATINGQNYKESIIWAWNFQGYPSYLEFNKNYKVFDFIARLSPEKGGNPSYSIIIYVFADDAQFKTNHPYIINSYKDENIDTLYWLDIIPYFARNASEILKESAEGIAYAASSVSEKRIPLKGELVLENINPQTNVCHGYYSFSSSENAPEKLVIKGEFETKTAINELTY